MINVKRAVQIALEYINSLYDEEVLDDLALEEAELSDNERYWLVTLGFTRRMSIQPGTFNPLITLGIGQPTYSERQYKVIKIRADTGKVISMRIRKL